MSDPTAHATVAAARRDVHDVAPDLGAVHADFSVHLHGLPDVEGRIDDRGWVSLYGRLGGWAVLDVTIYVPKGAEGTLADRIAVALGEPHPARYANAKRLEAHLLDAHNEQHSGRPSLEELEARHAKAHEQGLGRPHRHSPQEA